MITKTQYGQNAMLLISRHFIKVLNYIFFSYFYSNK